MKPYLLLGTWLDLDHVLAVTNMAPPEMVDGHLTLTLQFSVTLAFKEEDVQFGYAQFTFRDEEATTVYGRYVDFLEAWKNKDNTVKPEPAKPLTYPDDGTKVYAAYCDRVLNATSVVEVYRYEGAWYLHSTSTKVKETRDALRIIAWWVSGLFYLL
jgi:hypothetical protein